MEGWNFKKDKKNKSCEKEKKKEKKSVCVRVPQCILTDSDDIVPVCFNIERTGGQLCGLDPGSMNRIVKIQYHVLTGSYRRDGARIVKDAIAAFLTKRLENSLFVWACRPEKCHDDCVEREARIVYRVDRDPRITEVAAIILEWVQVFLRSQKFGEYYVTRLSLYNSIGDGIFSASLP